MGIADMLTPIIGGAAVLFLLGWFAFVGWWIMTKTGMLKFLLSVPIIRKVLKIKKGKPHDEVLNEIIEAISISDNTIDVFAKLLTTKSPSEKEQYIKAYVEIQEEMKGGKDGRSNETKDSKDKKEPEVPKPTS